MEQIGRYKIVEELGRGAMGVVYRAQDPAIGRTIAIKTIRLSELTEESERTKLRERLFREAQSAGILSHPGIVTIYDIAEDSGLAYIFMEFVNGPPLEKMLKADQTPDRETLVSILRQIAAALDYAHKKGIVHRDIKPANVMIHEDGSAKVTDFGVAKIVSQQMTQAGAMMGTPSYMSPEQIQGGAVDGRADQFSLAVMAYEVLTGEKPFSAEYLPTLLFKIVREDPVPPQRINPTLSPAVETVFRRGLAKTAPERYESCSDFVSALASACATNPNWTPLPRGAGQNMPTLASVSGAPTFDAEPRVADPSQPGRAVGPEMIPLRPACPTMNLPLPASLPAAPPQPASYAPPPQPGPPAVEPASRPRLEDHKPPGGLVRKLALVVGTVIAGGIGFLIYQKMTQPPPAAEATQEEQTPSKGGAKNSPKDSGPKRGGDVPDKAPDSGTAADPGAPSGGASPEKNGPATSGTANPPKADTPKDSAGAGGAGKAPPARNPARSTDVSFQLVTTPAGAEATIDGNSALACRTPCSLPLDAGRHTLVLRLDGYRDRMRSFELPKEATLSVALERTTGVVSITSNPPGLTILIDGKELGRTPAAITLPVGQYRVQVAKDGQSREFNVQVKDGGLSTHHIDWSQ